VEAQGRSHACAGSRMGLPGDDMLELAGNGRDRDEKMATPTVIPGTRDYAR
jgi:hypothetical protein